MSFLIIKNTPLFKVLVTGMETLGATFIKCDSNFVYFELHQNTKLRELELRNCKIAWKDSFGIGLKIKRNVDEKNN